MDTFEIQSLKENASNIRILYVENHAGTRLKFSRLFKEYFNEVVVVTYADNAIQLFLSGHFDLIITDANLPDMEVTLMCKNIKRIATRKPIIVVSNIIDQNTLVELINIGISGFIQTPCEKDDVLKVLSKVVLDIADMKIIYNVQDQNEQNIEKNFDNKYTQKDDIHLSDTNLLDNNNLSLLLQSHGHISSKEFAKIYPHDLLIIGNELLSIIGDIDLHVNQFVNDIVESNALKVSKEFKEFSNLLYDIDEFSNISFSTQKLSIIFSSLDYSKLHSEYYDVILQISVELIKWCEDIFINQNANNIHYLDKLLLADALMLENLFRGSPNT